MIKIVPTLVFWGLLIWLFFGGGVHAAGTLASGLGMAGLFVLGSIGFWVLMVAACVVLCIADEKESGVGATLTVLVTLLLLMLCGNFNPEPWLTAHWPLLLPALAAYFAFGGGAWAAFMLRRRAKKERARYEAAFDRFLADCHVASEEELNPVQRAQWREHRKKGCYGQTFIVDKKIADYKPLIIYWICYWPTSLLWFLISDLVKEIADEVFHRLQSFYQRVWDGVWQGARGSF